MLASVISWMLFAAAWRARQEVVERFSSLEAWETVSLTDLGTAIPVVAQQRKLISDIQTDEWWADVTYPMVEDARKRLRNLVQLIVHTNKNVLYSDFADEFGGASVIKLPGTGEPGGDGDAGGDADDAGGGDEFAQFRKRTQHFLKESLATDVVAKVRSGAPTSHYLSAWRPRGPGPSSWPTTSTSSSRSSRTSTTPLRSEQPARPRRRVAGRDSGHQCVPLGSFAAAKPNGAAPACALGSGGWDLRICWPEVGWCHIVRPYFYTGA